jgi:D-glycero-D-manno-heptose 1,7-bisphosphate phosphatase
MTFQTNTLLSLVQTGTWSIFLDRDGVINKRIPGDYIKTWSEFKFIEGVRESLAFFNSFFSNIFMVTNQQGISKGIMTVADLEALHQKMMEDITLSGGRIDKIYFCPDLATSGSLYRKPNIGMALMAKKDFPELSLKQSFMAGDSLSDMKFGKRAGMKTVLIHPDLSLVRKHFRDIDFHFSDLQAFSNTLKTL